MAVFACDRRASMVPVAAMPMLPPRFRIRLNRLVALPIRSGLIESIVTVVSGTKSSAIADALDQLRPEHVPVARLQIQVPQPPHRQTADEQARGEQLPRIDLAREDADDRHHAERPDAAWGHRDARLQGRIAEQRLQHHRQQHHAAVEHEAHDRHQENADRVAALAEDVQLDDRIIGAPLVHDQPDQRDRGDDRQGRG